MTSIKGKITGVVSTGSYTNDYGLTHTTNITVQTDVGPVTGELGSKDVLGQEILGQIADFTMTTGQHGNKFKKHNPKYDGQGGSSGGQSGGRDYDKANHGKCFTNLLGAVMGTYALSGKWPNEADYIHLADLATVCMNSYDYRTTGTQPATEPPAGEDIPF